MSHGKIMCSCGRVIAQCRCIDHGNRIIETRPHPACGLPPLKPPAPPLSALSVDAVRPEDV